MVPFPSWVHAHGAIERRAGMVHKFLRVPQLMMWKGCHCLACHATCTVYRDWTGMHIYVPQVLSSVCMFVCARVCLSVSLRLRGVERRGHTEPVTKLIRQIPVTWVTFSQLRSGAHTMWTGAAVSVICLFSICILSPTPPPSLSFSGFRPMHFFLACLFNFWWNIYALPKVKGTASLSKQEEKWEHVHTEQAKSKREDRLVDFVSDTSLLYAVKYSIYQTLGK